MTYNDKTGYYETEINGKSYFIRKKDMEQLAAELRAILIKQKIKHNEED